MRTLRISAFPGHTAPPRTVETTWPALSHALTEHREIAQKDHAPAWSPSIFRNALRSKHTAEGTDCLVFDLDKGEQSDFWESLQRLRALGASFVTYTSHSYRPDGPSIKARVILETTRTITPAEFPRVWRHTAKTYFARTLDFSTSDVSRLYWLPSCVPGAPRFASAFPGLPLDVDAVLSAAPPEDEREPIRPFKHATEGDLAEILKSWRGRKWRASRSALEALIERQSIAIPGERDNTIFRLVRDLVREAPHLTTDSLADLFVPSIAAMGAPHDYRDEIARKIDRARDTVIAEQPKPDGGPPIVQVDSSAAVYVKSTMTGRYVGPIARIGAVERFEQLQGAEIAAGRITLLTIDGKRKGLADLIRELGTGVSCVEHEIGRESASIESDVLVLGCAVPPKTEPIPSLRVDNFLRLLVSEQPDSLRDVYCWLVQAIKRPHDPLVALTIIGPRDIGKNLFAACVASLWGPNAQPTNADEAFDTFNEGLLECPLIHADERLPKDGRGRTTSALLRNSITSRTIRLNRKFQALETIRGAPRWLVTVNDAKSISFQEDLGPADVEAIAERLYQIQVSDENGPAIAERVRALGPEKILEEFAGHIEWASQAVQFEKKCRLWIQHPGNEIKRALTVGGYRSDVLAWIASWMLNPQQFGSIGRPPVSKVLDDGRTIMIASRDLLDGWECYCKTKRLSHMAMGSALAAIGSKHRDRTEIGRVRLTAIDLEIVCAWADVARFCDPQELRNAALAMRAKPATPNGAVARVIPLRPAAMH